MEKIKNTPPKHPSYHRLLKSSPETAILTSICKSFIIEDEEFYKHERTRENKHNPLFWIELGQHMTMVVSGHLATKAMQEKTEAIPLIDYIMCQRFRADLIDILIPAIERYLDSSDEYED